MTKWLIGFVAIEFLFILACVIGIDRRRERGVEMRPRGETEAWPPANLVNGWRQDDDKSEAPRG